MKVVFFGTPEFAVPTLRRLADSEHEIALVVTRPDKPMGRRQVLTPPPVAELANQLNLPLAQPRSLKKGDFIDELRALEPDVAVVVAYGRLIPAEMLEVPRHGCVNLHPSLLPRHRGPSPIQWALVSGDRATGVTTMLLDEGMDTGPILLQRSTEIDPKETAEQLSPRLAEMGAELMLATLAGLADGSVEPKPQSDQGANVTPMLRRGFGKVEWDTPARRLINRLRGFSPWPGLYCKLRGGRVKLFGLEEARAEAGDEPPGTVLAADETGIVVRCGRGTAVRITELQREGRRRLPVDAFQIGERVTRGEQFS
jgi:methionyl-tRNA formyltransferase